MKYIVKDNEIGFVLKNERCVKTIGAGEYHFPKMLGYDVVLEEMSGELRYLEVPYDILKQDALFMQSTVRYQIPDNQIGFIYKDGILVGCTNRSEYIFWNTFEKMEIKLFSMEDVVMSDAITKKMRSVIPTKYYTRIVVGEGEVGLICFDQKLKQKLDAGVYYFWNYNTEITYYIVDQKWKELNIVGQEILTHDKIGIRLNVVCNYRIIDAENVVLKRKDLEKQLYSYTQLVIRELVGNYRLDEILEKKVEISELISKQLQANANEYYVEFSKAGIKDIILPGEIRDIMNTVLVAEKKAQANVIERREEVASTRSLLNTAKLMEENETLFQLKKLEYLERICGKVGEISVAGNSNLLEQLGNLMG